jgi:hypothetical protein
LGAFAVTTKWLLAKYVSDLQRNEPQNIGLILLRDDEIATRFIGQRHDGTIDGRSAKYVRSAATYKAWVEYWRSLVAQGDVDALLAMAHSGQRKENYVLEAGGEIVLGSDPWLETADILDDLYGRLVEDTDPALENVGRLAERVIERVQQRLGHPIERGSKVVVESDGVLDELKFDYRYNNGRPHLMRTLSLSYADSRSWDRLHSIAWSFTQIQQANDASIREADLIALVRTREPDEALEKQILALEQRANVIDVSKPDQAENELLELISD